MTRTNFLQLQPSVRPVQAQVTSKYIYLLLWQGPPKLESNVTLYPCERFRQNHLVVTLRKVSRALQKPKTCLRNLFLNQRKYPNIFLKTREFDSLRKLLLSLLPESLTAYLKTRTTFLQQENLSEQENISFFKKNVPTLRPFS